MLPQNSCYGGEPNMFKNVCIKFKQYFTNKSAVFLNICRAVIQVDIQYNPTLPVATLLKYGRYVFHRRIHFHIHETFAVSTDDVANSTVVTVSVGLMLELEFLHGILNFLLVHFLILLKYIIISIQSALSQCCTVVYSSSIKKKKKNTRFNS